MTTVTEYTYATVDEYSTRDAVLEAIKHCVQTAGRCPAFDHLSNLNPAHEKIHGYLDELCDLLTLIELKP